MVRNIQNRPLYPWLFALYPVLFLFSTNISLIALREVAIAAAYILFGTTYLYLMAYLLTKNRHKAALITSLGVVVFFAYGHVFTALQARWPSFFTRLWLWPLHLIVFVVGIVLVWRMKRFSGVIRATPAVNAMGLILMLLTLPSIATYYYRAATLNPQTSSSHIESSGIKPDAALPDVYFIVLDGYSSRNSMLRDTGYDNTPFIEALEEREFYVALDAKSNYARTMVSIPSTLNMRYLTDEDRAAAYRYPDPAQYLSRLMVDNQVAQEFQARGYEYVAVLSGFVPPSITANLNIDFCPGETLRFRVGDAMSAAKSQRLYKRPFLPFLFRTTLLRDVAHAFTANSGYCGYGVDSPERILATFEEAERIAGMPQPTFTFIHIVKPHAPLVFDRNGNAVSSGGAEFFDTPEDWRLLEEGYFDQLEFLNERVLQMVDTIQARSEVPPVIIIQADHGTPLGSGTRLDPRLYFEILSAMVVPGHVGCIEPHPALTSVNTFRLVLNCLFEAEMPLLEDRHYQVGTGNDGYFLLTPVDMEEWAQQMKAISNTP
jgi:hypothetical protein